MEVQSKGFASKDAQRLLGFLKNAYDDYISARTLLNHNLILQGAVLANTSIEKYFKAILTFKGDTPKHIHSIVKLFGTNGPMLCSSAKHSRNINNGGKA